MKSASRWLTITRFSLSHWLYTQSGLNSFLRWQHSKKMLTKRERRLILLFSPAFILKIQKKYTQPWFLGVKKGVNLVTTWFTPFAAESGGFEPPVRLPVRQFSKLLVSATHPTLRVAEHSLKCRCKINPFFLFSKEKKGFLFHFNALKAFQEIFLWTFSQIIKEFLSEAFFNIF